MYKIFLALSFSLVSASCQAAMVIENKPVFKITCVDP